MDSVMTKSEKVKVKVNKKNLGIITLHIFINFIFLDFYSQCYISSHF